TTRDGQSHVGWVYGRIGSGCCLSLDPQGRQLRMFPDIRGLHVVDNTRASFARSDLFRAAEDFNKSLGAAFQATLTRIDYNLIKRLSLRLSDLRSEHDRIQMLVEGRILGALAKEYDAIPFFVSRVLSTSEEIYTEISSSGLAPLLDEHRDQLAKLLDESLLP